MKMRVRNKAAWTDEVTTLERKNLQVAYDAATEGIVLLENDGCLPIKPGKVALFGAGGSMTIKGGTGSGEVNERHAITIEEGLNNAGFKVTTEMWLRCYEDLFKREENRYGKELVKKVLSMKADNVMEIMSNPFQYPFGNVIREIDIADSDTDTCIYVVARQAGEGGDRRVERYEYSLSDVERESIALCAQKYEKMIVVINVGSTFDMSFVDDIPGINAVVYYCQQGTMGGNAFADLICGKGTPSGKLSDTWAVKYEDIPYSHEYSYLNGDLDEEYYKEGIYVGYRYFDSYKVEPKYPFGYGLSYTDFDIEVREVSVRETCVKVRVNITNTGTVFSGKEVVQLYVSCPQGDIPKEYQKLAGFEKTKTLVPGASQELTVSFAMEDIASYRYEDGAMVLEAGEYILRVGNSSRNTKAAAVLRLDNEVITQRLTHICAREEAVEEIEPAKIVYEELDESVPVVIVDADAFTTFVPVYGPVAAAESELATSILNDLSVRDLVALSVGIGNKSGAFFHTPGAVGVTTNSLIEKGVPNICLADGPAGLRLQRYSAVLKSGKIKPVEPVISMMKYIPDVANKVLLADPDKHPVIYQFTTAFPVGLALAQTWNKRLIERIGSAVGEEMEAYGITYWLAPALNIHRNPLCGRNFEYYSEDPYLSGVIAAAMTKGVQQHRGCYVTLKHYCCNNQEDNRNRNNSNVNERALREIYLKGFEIAVRQARPGAIMSSYNKVNGVYANNSYDLMTKVLRNEWGFDKVIMTDWYATGKKLGSHSLAIEAGTDLIMPGGPMVEKAVYDAVKSGLIREEDVRRSAARVLDGILSSRIYQAYRKRNKS